MKGKTLKFYDVKAKKKFSTDKYRTTIKKNPRTKLRMKFAIAKGPSGNDCWRVLGKA